MHAELIIKNRSDYPVLYAYADGEIMPHEIIRGEDVYLRINSIHCMRVTICTASRQIYDLWLPIAGGACIALEIHNNYCGIICIPPA